MMAINRLTMTALFMAVMALFHDCTVSRGTDEKVVLDNTWVKKIMPDHGGGITGGDGSISIDLKDGRALFMWGDSFIGDVNNDTRSKDSKLIVGNTFTTIDDKGNVRSYYNGTKSHPVAYIPVSPKGDSECWYWPGNGFVHDGILFLFMSKFKRTGSGTFSFQYQGCDLFSLDARSLKIINKVNFPAANINDVHYGHAVLRDGNTIYVYGSKYSQTAMKASVHVSKAMLHKGKIEGWQFWDGSRWQSDPYKSRSLDGIRTNVSEQFSVFELKGKVVLVTQERLDKVRDVYSYTSDHPVGPFRNEQKIYTVNEENWAQDKMMTYNAMAHPQFQEGGKILMCYNVNTHDTKKLFEKASLYQPRFFWVPVGLILNSN